MALELTDNNFEELVLKSDKPVMVDFWAEWCGPCRMVGPILDKLAGEFAGQIKVAKVNVDENPGLSQAFRIQSIPNLMIVKQRTMIFNQPGALPEASLRDLIQQDADFEDAWLWMSVAVDSLDQSSVCLDNVLRVNPQNMPAAGALYRLREPEMRMEKRRARLQLIHRVLFFLFWLMILGMLFAVMVTEMERMNQIFPVIQRGANLLNTP